MCPIRLDRPAALPLALLLASCGGPTAPPREPADIVAQLDLQLDAEEQAIARLGDARLLRRIRRCVARHGLPPRPPGAPDPSATLARLDLAERRVAIDAYAADAATVAACGDTGRALIDAAARRARAERRMADALHLADTVVIARAGARRAEDRGDGLRSSLPLVVEECLRGALGRGAPFVVRIASGPLPDGTTSSVSGEPHVHAGRRYLVVASRAAYRVAAVAHGAMPAAADRAPPALLARGGVFALDRPELHTPWGVTRLAAVRAQLRIPLRPAPRPPPSVPASARVQTADESRRRDAREFARSRGITEAQALTRMRVSEGLAPVIADLRTRLRPSLAGIAIEDAPEVHLQVRLTGAGAPWTEVRSIAGERVPIRYLPGSPVTVDAMLDAMQRHGPRLQRALPGLQGMGVDERAGRLQLDVHAPPSEHAALRRRAQALEAAVGVPLHVAFLVAPMVIGEAPAPR